MQDRKNIISDFLKKNGWENATRQAIKGDASFRSYERIVKDNGGTKMAILMDAPPPKEDVRPFVKVTEYLRKHGFSAPEILAKDEQNGLLLLEDLKIDSYSLVLSGASLLSNDRSIEEKLYAEAIDVLTALHKCPLPSFLPPYDSKLLLKEVSLFTEWYLPYKGIVLQPGQKEEFDSLWLELLPQLEKLPRVFIHRDYHADNLMWLGDRQAIARVGLLDYQDAVAGSPAYDLVSLLEDARRDVSPETVSSMIGRFLETNPHLDADEFFASYAIMGAQRNLKIIGIFTRLCVRDKKPKYLDFLPRVWKNLETDLEHTALVRIKLWLDKIVPDHTNRHQKTTKAGRAVKT